MEKEREWNEWREERRESIERMQNVTGLRSSSCRKIPHSFPEEPQLSSKNQWFLLCGTRREGVPVKCGKDKSPNNVASLETSVPRERNTHMICMYVRGRSHLSSSHQFPLSTMMCERGGSCGKHMHPSRRGPNFGVSVNSTPGIPHFNFSRCACRPAMVLCHTSPYVHTYVHMLPTTYLDLPEPTATYLGMQACTL